MQREADLGFCIGDGADEERHVPAEVAHDLQSLEVFLDVRRGVPVDLVPVGAGNDRHAADGEILVEHIERRGVPAPPAADNRGADFHLLRKIGAVKQPVHERQRGRVRRSVIDRATDDQAVGLFELRRHFIDFVVEYAPSVFHAKPTGFAAGHVVCADVDKLRFDAFGVEGLDDFLQSPRSAALCVWAAVDQEYFMFHGCSFGDLT